MFFRCLAKRFHTRRLSNLKHCAKHFLDVMYLGNINVYMIRNGVLVIHLKLPCVDKHNVLMHFSVMVVALLVPQMCWQHICKTTNYK